MPHFGPKIQSALDSAFELHKNEFQRLSNLKKINFFGRKKLTKILVFGGPISKSDDKSTKIRETGNMYYCQKKFLEALECYTGGVAQAESSEVAALAYSNRSALLSRMGLYKECLADIDRALEHNYPKESRSKLLLRQLNAMQSLNVSKSGPEAELEQSVECFKIHKNKNFGRHVIATKNINIGDVIVTERPFASVLLRDFFLYCHHCLSFCYNLIPCTSCTKSLYCSEACSAQALSYHKYECGIINESFYAQNHQLMLALKITLIIVTQMREKNFETNEKIKKLLTHSNKRSLKDVFMLSWSTSLIFTLLNERTTLFTDFKNLEDTFKELFLTSLQIVDINLVSINRLQPNSLRYEDVRYGCGLYLTYSVFNHSCTPNAFFYHDGTQIVVRALETIERGQQCFISYGCTYSTTNKLTRQTMLRSKFHFTCMCTACLENWPEEDESEAFEQPFACVQLAILRNDRELLKDMLCTFIRNLRLVEKCPPAAAIPCLKQLIVDCYQVYENPRRIFGKSLE